MNNTNNNLLPTTNAAPLIGHARTHLVELVLELDPVQAEGVEEALEDVHAGDDGEGDPRKDGEGEEDADGRARLDEALDGLLEEDFGQLGVREGERPQAEVRGGVAHHAQHELDRLDRLVNHHLAEPAVLVMPPVPAPVVVPALLVVGVLLRQRRVLVACRALLVLAVDDAGLGAEEDGDGGEGQEEEEDLRESKEGGGRVGWGGGLSQGKRDDGMMGWGGGTVLSLTHYTSLHTHTKQDTRKHKTLLTPPTHTPTRTNQRPVLPPKTSPRRLHNERLTWSFP